MLQEHPHLFANGKFKTIDHTPNDVEVSGTIYGIINNDLIFGNPNAMGGWQRNINNCTLIARPIEDMTDEEIIDFEGSLINVDRKIVLKVIEDADRLEAWGMLNLLSIGVYPFDQSHFKDGIVIDSRTI